MTELDDLLALMIEKGATDLHIKIGKPPIFRIKGKIVSLQGPPISTDDITRFSCSIMDEEQSKKFEKRRWIDLSYSIRGLSRFRTNIFHQRGTMAMAIRAIPFKVPSIDELGLPDVAKDLSLKQNGLVLVTGPAGAGKSTTLAAMLDHINSNRECHIATIEDPIEYLFQDKKATITQREVGQDAKTMNDALIAIFRQDPDAILLGELRDLEDVKVALRAAETGHFVLTTLHTTSAAQTVERILSLFPSEYQSQVRMQLSLCLQGVITQRLVKTKDETGRVAAVEIMLNSPTIRTYIEKGNTSNIYNAISAGVSVYRMQTLEQSLIALVANDVITYQEAYLACNNSDILKRTLQGFGVEVPEMM
ncbi:MAG: PilT/PilU family type 4a pilus ATPase [bacterium]|nr:PilT/PilU family type 4a pilus ATPase [bacterium]